MPNKLLSVFNVGGENYNLKDAAATAKLEKLLGKQAVQELGAILWKSSKKQPLNKVQIVSLWELRCVLLNFTAVSDMFPMANHTSKNTASISI